jgi:hypothetical protein
MKMINWMYSSRPRFLRGFTVFWTIIMTVGFARDIADFGVVKILVVVVMVLAVGVIVGGILWELFAAFDPKRFKQ